jgi:hypothetical protein
MYNYVHFEEKFGLGLEEFVARYVKPNLPVRRVKGYLGRNQQLWDLGYAESAHTHNMLWLFSLMFCHN